jgi:hypothetical protein
MFINMKSRYEPVIIRGNKISAYRFNPNIIAVSVVVIEAVGMPNNFSIARIVTYRQFMQRDGRDVSMAATSVDIQKFVNGVWFSDGRERRILGPLDTDSVKKQHEKSVKFQIEGIKNPAYKAMAAEDYVFVDDWSREEAEKYQGV